MAHVASPAAYRPLIARQTYTRAAMTPVEPEPGFLSLGQHTARTIATRSAASGRLQRTLLVHGPSGAGKGAFVDDLLALLFCTDADPERRPCNACRGCRDARARRHPDLVIGSTDRWREARSPGESIVAAARRWLLESAGAPVVAERRVIVIERADAANEQIQNALLKALEEPAPRQMFILIADEPSRLLPTIRSRSQALRVGPVARDELVVWLMDRERLPEDQALALARLSHGLAGSAVALARNHELVAWRRRTQAELLALLERGRADRFSSVRDLLNDAGRLVSGDGATEREVTLDAEDGRPSSAAQRAAALLLAAAWLELTRDLIVTASGEAALAGGTELHPELPRAAERIGIAPLASFAALLERIRDGLEQNAAPRLALEVAMLEWPTVPAGGS
jgi:hypothetical protein